MKYNIFIAIILSFFLSSCEEVIDLKLDTTSSKIVIQGNIFDQPGPYIVTLSQTVDFDEASNYPPISGATVVISDDQNNTDTLSETTAGTYVTSKLVGVPGHTYNLTVTTGGKTYSAVSKMPEPVNIDSVYTEEISFNNAKLISIKFNDPANIKNYYRVVEFINSERQEAIQTINDEYYDGETIKYSVRSGSGRNSENLKTGDAITIWLESIDKGVYDYFRTAGGDMSQSSSPSNPISNISNGALGYFNACSIKTSTLVVP